MYRTLKQIDQLLSDIELKINKITGTGTGQAGGIGGGALSSLKSLERVALRYLAVVRQIGLPEDAEQLIQVVTRIIVVIRMAQISLASLAGGPFGIAMGAAGLLLTGLSAGSMLEGY